VIGGWKGKQLLPSSRETSIVGGHLGFWERPGEVAKMIAEFARQRGNHTKPAGTKPTNVASD
jgi:hypothetical protein